MKNNQDSLSIENQLKPVCIIFLISILFTSCTSKVKNAEELSNQPPNILFCLADDASFPHMSAYGTRWLNTPTFDRVANEGILFMNAYTPNSKCAPSRACILTGRNSWQLEEAANHWSFFPDKFKSVLEALSEQGYFVGHTSKGWGPGVVREVNGERRLLTGKAYNERTLEPPTESISKIDYAANFEDFLNEQPKGKPFFFWYGSAEPHRPYTYSSSITLGKTTAEIDQVPEFWPDNDTVRTDMLDYAYEIEYFDQHISAMLKVLEERGELDNTIVVVTADNGMPFPRVKSHAYEMSNHVPLAIMWKNGIRKGDRKVMDFVSFIDFAPTFLEVAGISLKDSGMTPIEGKSLIDIFSSEKEGQVNIDRDFVLIGKERHDVGRPNDEGYPIRGIVKDNFLYLKNYEPTRWPSGNPETGYLATAGAPTKTSILLMRRSGKSDKYWSLSFGKRLDEELYDLSKDLNCIHNLAIDPEFIAIKQSLREDMEGRLRNQDDPRMFGKGYIFDEYEYADPKNANFYKRFMDGEEMKAGWVNKSDFEEESLK